MAKRRKRKSSAPNLPQEALDRARQQIDGTLEEDADTTPDAEPEAVAEEDVQAEQAEPAVKSSRTTTARSSRRRERRTSAGSSSRSSAPPTTFQRNKRTDMDHQEMTHLLANPTRIVSEEELHEEYGYVLRDLRSMGILAAALMIFLVLLAQFI